MKKIQNRLILAFLAVILLTLCGVSGGLLLLLRTNTQAERLAFYELNLQARALTDYLRRRVDFPLGDADFETLEALARREEVRLAGADDKRRVHFDSEHRWDAGEGTTALADLNRQENGRWMGTVREDQRRWLVVAHPIITAEGLQGYVVVAKLPPRPTPLRSFRDTLAMPLLQAGAVALILGVLLAALISRSIARPLQQLAGAARALASGDLDARAPVAGPEEVRSVAESFNEMADRVAHSQRAQRDLVANVAHDLRTPLTSIQGFAQALVDGTAATPKSQAQAASAIYEEARRMHRMTAALLDLARFEAGEVHLRREPVNLGELAQRRVERFSQQAEEAGVALTVEAGEPVAALADAGRIEQVLDNLIANALAHTREGGRVTVTVAAPESRVAEIAVADTGTGIPAEALPRIFERFYRGDKARQGQGTGLGLAIAREIARAHGGGITAESVVGVGSKFTVRLPASHPAEKGAA